MLRIYFCFRKPEGKRTFGNPSNSCHYITTYILKKLDARIYHIYLKELGCENLV